MCFCWPVKMYSHGTSNHGPGLPLTSDIETSRSGDLCLNINRTDKDILGAPLSRESEDFHPGQPTSLRFGSTEDEHKPLLCVNNPHEPSLSSVKVQARGLPKEVKKKKHVRFRSSERDADEHQERCVRNILLPHIGKDYDSLDFDVCYNVPYKERIRRYSKKTYTYMELVRWMLAGVVGILTGTVAFVISISDKYLLQVKRAFLDKIYDNETGLVLGFLVLLSFNILFATIGATMIAFEPVAGGSGIKEIRSYLNGVKVPHVVRISTLISKTAGVLFSVAGGFFVGKEGPMIHSGAIIGVGLSQLWSKICRCLRIHYSFKSDRDRRDFASYGAAAGVAAAFGAPIGGVLFSLEEASSFWNQVLTWRTLFCSFCATFTLNLFLSLSMGDKFGFLKLGSPGLVNFGIFGVTEEKLWSAYHLIIFMIMGAVGGSLGALFNSLNVNLTKYRMRYLYRRSCRGFWRILEALLIVMVTTTCIYLAATLLGTCIKKKPISKEEIICPGLIGDLSFMNETRNLLCSSHGTMTDSSSKHYNDMATLVFNSQETAIKQLFHQSAAFSLPTLWIFFLIYFLITCWTYGAGISGGAFTPSLVIGAAFGRFMATIFGYLTTWQPHYFYFLTNINPGVYALIGAVSILGGVKRMILSFSVILIECTNEISLGLPILLTLMVAKWVGDCFNLGLSNLQINLASIPFLGWESPECMDRLIAADVMSSNNLCYVYPITRVQSVERLLRTTAYSAFLVVTPVEPEHVPERPKNVQDTHIPQLYTPGGDWTVTEGENDIEPELRRRELSPAELKRLEPEAQWRRHDRFSTLSYSLPQDGRGNNGSMGTQSPNYTDEREETLVIGSGEDHGRKLLMFHGIILRSQLIELLKNKVFFNENEGPESQVKISHSQLTSDYPRYPSVFEVMKGLTPADRLMLMDLSLYMNPCPYAISHEAPLPQVFNLFRTMGLRHLPVMQESGIVVGIITRHDLTHESLSEKWHQKKAAAKRQRRLQRHSLDINDSVTFSRNDDDVFV